MENGCYQIDISKNRLNVSLMTEISFLVVRASGRLNKMRSRVLNRCVVAQIFLWLGHEDMAATGNFTENEKAKRNLELLHKIATTIDYSYTGKLSF